MKKYFIFYVFLFANILAFTQPIAPEEQCKGLGLEFANSGLTYWTSSNDTRCDDTRNNHLLQAWTLGYNQAHYDFFNNANPKTDLIISDDIQSAGSGNFRIGDNNATKHYTTIKRSFKVSQSNYIFDFVYSVIFEQSTCSGVQKPFFHFTIKDQSGTTIEEILEVDDPLIGTNKNEPFKTYGNFRYKNKQKYGIELSSQIGQILIIEMTVADAFCEDKIGYAYIDFDCGNIPDYTYTGCTYPLTVNAPTLDNPQNYNYCWYEESDVNFTTPIICSTAFFVPKPGQYTLVIYDITDPVHPTIYWTYRYNIFCPPPCINCIPSFSPDPGKTYVVSSWVKQSDFNSTVTTQYSDAKLKIKYLNSSNGEISPPNGSVNEFMPFGKIIEGWQRIDGEFTIPLNCVKIEIELLNMSDFIDVFFDDVRIHPKEASLKSFVYDPVSLKLVAELDENNYATFYEYDDEGNLVRVKKETERGIMTIQESKSNTRK